MADFDRIFNTLNSLYPSSLDFINFESAFELLIGVILSAQTTDARVNLVLPVLFERFPTPIALANASDDDIIEIIRSLGFYNSKCRSVKGAAFSIANDFWGQVPSSMKELLKIPGVGRKSANVILGRIFGKPAIIVDTHFGRVCRRIGFTCEKKPELVERDLKGIVPDNLQYRFSQVVNNHGRVVCKAKNPLCDECAIFNFCDRVF